MSENKDNKKLGEFKCIRDLRTSSRMKISLVRNDEGRLFLATYLNREKLLTHYKASVHHKDESLSLDEVEAKASDRYNQVAIEFKAMYERVKDLSHPYISEYYQMIHEDSLDIDIIISEYVSGQSLFDATDGLTPRQMIAIFVRAFEALDYQHASGILNMNIKSNSFRVNLESENPGVKLMNYGFAIPKGEYKGRLRGTDYYVSPEVVFGQRDKIDERADLYSMAALMYRCVSRKYPFPARKSAERNLERLKNRVVKEDEPSGLKNFRGDVPEDLECLIFTLLKKNPDERKEFDKAKIIVNYFHEKWPKASREMVVEHTITTSDSEEDEREMNE